MELLQNSRDGMTVSARRHASTLTRLSGTGFESLDVRSPDAQSLVTHSLVTQSRAALVAKPDPVAVASGTVASGPDSSGTVTSGMSFSETSAPLQADPRSRQRARAIAIYKSEERGPKRLSYQRAGLTEAEARRVTRSDSLRANTRSPWETPPLRVLPWLLWRCVFKGFQPALFLVFLAIAVFLTGRMVAESGGLYALVEDDPALEARLDEALAEAGGGYENGRTLWQDQMRRIQAGDRLRRVDLYRFHSWAGMGPSLMGRDTLALALLAGSEDVEERQLADARLRAGPVWQRETEIEQVLTDQLALGADAGLEPAELVFLPAELRTVSPRAQRLYQIAQSEFEAFMRDPHRGQMDLNALPGLVAGGQAQPRRVLGGVRELILQACAHRADVLAGCADPVIPSAAPDTLRLQLAALEAGLVRTGLPRGAVEDGAGLLLVLEVSGGLHPELRPAVRADLDQLVPVDTVLQRLGELDVRADLGFATPRLIETRLGDPLVAPASLARDRMDQLLRATAQIRRTSDPLTALRVLPHASTVNEAERLVALLPVSGPRLMAILEVLGDEAYGLVNIPPPPPPVDPRLQWQAGLVLSAALLVLLISLRRLARRPVERRAGRFHLLDAQISRLLLGRKH